MLKYFIQVIQNLLSAAVLTALLSSLADKTDEGKGRRRFLFWGAGAVLAALAVAVLRRTTRLINREFLNTGILLPAILLGLFFILLLRLSGGKREGAKTGGLERISEWTSPVLAFLLLFYALPTVFLYPPEFLLPGQSVLSTDFLYKLIGYLAGLVFVTLISFALFESAGGLPLSVIKITLGASLAVNLVNQASVIMQFLLARRFISLPRRLFRIMVALINHHDVFLYIIMGVTLAIPLCLFIKNLRPPAPSRNPAEARKRKAARRGDRRRCALVAAGYIGALLSLTVIKAYNEREVILTPAEPMTISGNEIIIPIEQIEDGRLHRFNYTAADSIEMRFIVIKKNEAAYGVGLDACDICGPTGYYERKGQVICRLCDVVMNISTIGFKGGCNPVPLAYTLRRGAMIIAAEDLENERNRFK